MPKRNTASVRAAHNASRKGDGSYKAGADGKNSGKSRYAKKVKAGNQMYGPGCCAHRISLWSRGARVEQPVTDEQEAA